MRESLDKLLDRLGVPGRLEAYATCPWSAYDSDKEVSCMAEVRMSPDGEELESDIQLVRDNPKGDEKGMEQVLWQRFYKDGTGNWAASDIRVKGADRKSTYAWEEKGCELFKAVVMTLRRNVIPDIDELIEEIFNRNERFADQYGGGTSKSPKIKPQQLLDMKQGRGF
jgi:hypothetical protein